MAENVHNRHQQQCYQMRSSVASAETQIPGPPIAATHIITNINLPSIV